MSDHFHNIQPPPRDEEVIEEFFEETPRASELRQMRQALQERRLLLRNDFNTSTNQKYRTGLQSKLKELTIQIAAVREEEAISGFVEGTIRATLSRPPTILDYLTAEELESLDDEY